MDFKKEMDPRVEQAITELHNCMICLQFHYNHVITLQGPPFQYKIVHHDGYNGFIVT